MRLANKVGIVTAAGSGMGRAGAVRFAREGAAVGVVALEKEETADVVREIQDAGGTALALPGDLSDEDFSRHIVDATVAEFGGLDFVWNHIGIPGPAVVEDVDLADFDLAMNLNLRTVVTTTSQAIPHLRRRPGGNVLFTSSTSGLIGSPWSPIYSAAKFGVIGLTRALAKRYGTEGLRFNAICPGPIDTPMLRTFVARPDAPGLVNPDAEKLSHGAADTTVLARLGRPEEIAAAALFLVSDEASFVTGAALPVDGGVVA